jgi:hypothetical protein
MAYKNAQIILEIYVKDKSLVGKVPARLMSEVTL